MRVADLIYFADPALMAQRAEQLSLDVTINDLTTSSFRGDAFNVHPVSLAADVTAGQPDVGNASYVLQTLESAITA